MMREIVYINAGNLSNHIGTHFFNTQQAYLEQAETNPQEESPIDSNVSFRDGISNGIPTYCPRLLTFDYKQNFGALSKHNELYPASQDDSEDPLLEAGLIASHRAPLIPPSPYQVALAESRDFEITLKPRSVRYWSDYNRVFHLPRSLHPVPPPFNHQDLGSDEIVQNWSDGREAFSHLDAGTEICDEALRRFVEECDLLQGFQSMFDSLSFGSFTLAMIEAMGDEYPKSASLAFVNFGDTSSFVPSSLASPLQARPFINDALVMYNLACLAPVSLSVPLLAPSTWVPGKWSALLEDAELASLYHASAVMSMHVESVTSPARLRAPEGNRDLSSICKHLNWRGDTRVAGISGAMPLEGEWDTAIKSFSEVIDVPTRNTPFAQQAVFRGVPEERAAAWLEKGSMREPYLTNTYVPPAPIPSSFPFFRPAPSVPTYSSLTTGPGLLPLVENYARVVDYAIKRGWEFGEGVQRDELKEAKEGLWGVWGAYGGGEDGAEEERGEDE